MKPSTREPSQPQTTPPPTPTTTPSAATTTAEDEALKKNTDCVYFLASVLTCKKGDDCEYRHSQEARMNPRDCWYWLHRNCLNPSCSFRHPPLDGLVGKTVPPPVKASLPPSLPVASSQLPAANTSAFNPVKQATPCYYFQNGHCLKGDRCAFMHGPQPNDHVALQPPAPKLPTSVVEPQPLQKPVWALEKCNQQKNFRQENAIKQVEVPATVKPPVKVVPASLENGIATKKSLPPISLNDELSRYKAPNVPSVTSGNPVSRTQWGRQAQPLEDRNFRTVKEPEEFLGESSPGFDVLVEDELLEADYYEDDEFGRSKGHGGRHLNSANEIDYVRSAEYNPGAKFDRENYSDSRGYDTYERMQDRYPREQRKTSSERISDRPYVSERRALPRVESPEQIDELDLRYRLSKQRRINGSRSAVSPDARGDFYRRDDRGRHVEDQRYQGHTRRDSRYLPHESSVSNRLHGRISLPVRSSPDRNRNDSHLEKEMDRGRKYARMSPGRPPISSSISGRPQDRIRRRGEDEYDTEGRSFRAPFSRRDEADNSLDFAGPKRLVELKKGGRVSERGDEQQMRGIETSSGDSRHPKIRKFDSHQELEGSTSFEGPKPLREILKRKRQEKTIVSENSTASDFAEVDNQKEKEGNSQIVASEKQRDMPSNTKEDTSDLFVSSKEEDRFTSGNANGTVDEEEEEEEEEEGLIPEEVEDQPSVQKGNERETEDMIPIDNGEDEEFETSDQRDAESDYEQVDGDYKTEEDGNVDAEEEEEYEDDEDEDGDDFAKKIGVMFS